MGPRWFTAVLFVVLLMVPSVGAESWMQYRGNAERNAVVDPLQNVVDVVDRGLLQGEHVDHGGINPAPLVVQTDEGWVWSERHGTECLIMKRADLFDNTSETTTRLDDCQGGLLQAFDPVTDRTLVCAWVGGEGPVLRAVEPDGRTAWAVTPNGTLSLPMVRADDDEDEIFYRCSNTALDLAARVAYVTVNANCPGFGFNLPLDERVSMSECTGLHRLAAISLDDGSLLWGTEVEDELAQEGVFRVGALGFPVENEGSGARLDGITIVGEHLYVTFGKTCRTCRAEIQTGGAWFERVSGRQIGIIDRDEAELQDATAQRTEVEVSHSRLAVARDGIAYAYHRGEVYFIDPTGSGPLARIDLEEPEDEGFVTHKATPVWWNQRVVVPTHHNVYGIDSELHEVAWQWSGGRGWFVEHIVATADGEVVVLLVDLDRQRDRGARLVRLAAISGALVQDVPVDLDFIVKREETVTGDSNSWKVDLLPGPGGGILILDQHGGYAHIDAAPAGEELRLDLSTAYPATGDPVSIELEGAGATRADPSAIEVWWGDGMHRVYDPAEPLTHRYAENGDHDIRVTLVYADGITRSAKGTVHVGETPPTALTPLQQVFAPENADITWGVIGVLIALFGGLMAIARSRVRKNRLEYRLAQIERIKKRAEYDTPGAIRELDAHRTDLRDELRRGRLDDIQYAVLEGEIQRSLRLFYHRLLAPYEERMSARFRERLSASLEDGSLHPPEAHRLITELARENRLKAQEKTHLKGFFEKWSHGTLA